MEQQHQQQIQIKAADGDLKGRYSNMAQVAHSQEEFTLDFFYLAGPAGVLASRVILSPGHVKRLIAALQENLKRYEDRFGKVTASDQPHARIGFKTD